MNHLMTASLGLHQATHTAMTSSHSPRLLPWGLLLFSNGSVLSSDRLTRTGRSSHKARAWPCVSYLLACEMKIHKQVWEERLGSRGVGACGGNTCSFPGTSIVLGISCHELLLRKPLPSPRLSDARTAVGRTSSLPWLPPCLDVQ